MSAETCDVLVQLSPEEVQDEVGVEPQGQIAFFDIPPPVFGLKAEARRYRHLREQIVEIVPDVVVVAEAVGVGMELAGGEREAIPESRSHDLVAESIVAADHAGRRE